MGRRTKSSYCYNVDSTLPCNFLFLDFNNGMLLSYFRNNSTHSAIIVNDFDMVTALLGRVIINRLNKKIYKKIDKRVDFENCF